MSTRDGDITRDPGLTRAATMGGVERPADLGVTNAATVPPPSAVGAGGPPAAFAPGSIVAGRYRLVALSGRGGMGEVYRADDLTLDQAVDLKFLPGTVTDASRAGQPLLGRC